MMLEDDKIPEPGPLETGGSGNNDQGGKGNKPTRDDSHNPHPSLLQSKERNNAQEDALGEIRQSLLSEDKKKHKPGWVRRIRQWFKSRLGEKERESTLNERTRHPKVGRGIKRQEVSFRKRKEKKGGPGKRNTGISEGEEKPPEIYVEGPEKAGTSAKEPANNISLREVALQDYVEPLPEAPGREDISSHRILINIRGSLKKLSGYFRKTPKISGDIDPELLEKIASFQEGSEGKREITSEHITLSQVLKKSPSPSQSAGPSAEEIRDIALKEYVEPPPEPRVLTPPINRRLRSFFHGSKSIQRRVLIGFGAFGLAAIVLSLSFLVFSGLWQIRRPVVIPTPNSPYPTMLTIPGGWSFPLRQGVVVDGRWTPTGAEWLNGTEICRWIAIPWNLRLEATFRSLNPSDPIQLTMSNSDQLVYKVQTIQQIDIGKVSELGAKTSCLLVILSKSDSDKRWVLVAYP